MLILQKRLSLKTRLALNPKQPFLQVWDAISQVLPLGLCVGGQFVVRVLGCVRFRVWRLGSRVFWLNVERL